MFLINKGVIMMNFILDINMVSLCFSLFTLTAICVFSVDYVKNPKVEKGLCKLGIFLIFTFCLYLYFAVTFLNSFDENKEYLREEISKEYNVWISETAPDTLGFMLCQKSNYQSETCKEYISYFIPKAVRYEQELQEKIAKEREMEEEKEKEAQRLKEEEKMKKMNTRNRIKDIIKTEGENMKI